MIINYISPITNFTFDTKINSYYLVFVNSSLNNNLMIHKMELPNINNISEGLRAYHIGKGINTNKRSPEYSVRLFEHNKESNELKLLLGKEIDLNNIEYGNKQAIVMFQPLTIKYGQYKSDISFIDEQFMNYQDITQKNKCLLFVTKHKKITNLAKSLTLKFDSSTDPFIYNRYTNNIMKEHMHYDISDLCKTNSKSDYVTFIKNYQIDTNKYYEKDDVFKSMYMRKINLQFRKLHYDPYRNNIIVSPNDGRIKGFDINNDTNLKINNTMVKVFNFIDNDPEFLNGSGFISRGTHVDYQRFHLPYGGFLKGFSQLSSKILVLRFESKYFMPPDVHEREYISVIYGHNTNMSRVYPELVDKQPKIKLVFYVIVMADVIVLTNGKFKKDEWFNQGEELGVFNCCVGNVLTLFNRHIDFASDIDYYSSKLDKPIESYIRLNDIVGMIM